MVCYILSLFGHFSLPEAVQTPVEQGLFYLHFTGENTEG